MGRAGRGLLVLATIAGLAAIVGARRPGADRSGDHRGDREVEPAARVEAGDGDRDGDGAGAGPVRRAPAARRAVQADVILGDASPLHDDVVSLRYLCDLMPADACAEGRRQAAACATADVGACAGAAATVERARLGDEHLYRAAACQLGDAGSCTRWQRLDELRAAYRDATDGGGDGDGAPPADVAARCRAGDLDACATQLEIEQALELDLDASAARQVCDGGGAAGCLFLAQAVAEPTAVVEVLRGTCERGVVLACRWLYQVHTGGDICEDLTCPPPDPLAAARTGRQLAALTGRPFVPPDDDERPR